jgi:replicative DNA helicase Mcm
VGVIHGKPRSEIAKMQIFMEVLKGLEGEPPSAVGEKLFIDELVKSGKFDEEESRRYIKKMSEEGTIYEAKVGHYKRV